ncbi:hypothetical protein [Sphingomonas sp. PP-F2F-G114-C0414]|nr:hypothetical protein [Sphingomonas sp. PP-F2F-G114-C0414]
MAKLPDGMGLQRPTIGHPTYPARLPTSAARPANDKRLDGDNPFGDTLFTERNWQILDELKRVAAEINETPARVALS